VLRAADPESSVGAVPQLLRCADEDGQSAAVCERVLGHRELGIALREQAVVFRAAHHADALELELSRRGIPYVKYGGLRYLEAAHIKDLLALFRLADNRHDEMSWFRLLQLFDGVGPATCRRAIAALDLERPDPSADDGVLERWPAALALLPDRVRGAADAIVSMLPSRAAESVAAHAARLAAAIVPLVEQNYPNAAARLQDLDALVQAAGSCARLTDVAADFSLEPPRSTGELAGPPLIDEDWLTLTTVHSAKGLEWDVVHVLHAADGNFPSDMSLGTKEGLEEERRLFYVALTRPRRALHVYFPLRYHHHRGAHDDAHSWAQPSRFLSGGVSPTLDEVWLASPEAAPAAISVPQTTAAIAVASQMESLWR
jgi:DNA helicase-2/ATP-dependent DNA helicase PcrA